MRCEERLKTALRAVGQAQADPAAEPKGTRWKIAVAAWMKQNTEASNGWLAEQPGDGERLPREPSHRSRGAAAGLGRRANLATTE